MEILLPVIGVSGQENKLLLTAPFIEHALSDTRVRQTGAISKRYFFSQLHFVCVLPGLSRLVFNPSSNNLLMGELSD